MASILIIEDDPTLRSLFKRFLGSKGYSILLAENGKEGLRLLREKHPDLVITDIMMPEMDGLELLMAIRNGHDSVPVIAISGGMRSLPVNFLQNAKVMGARHVFEKPVSLDELLRAVEELLPQM